MSTKASLFLTNEKEHCYHDVIDNSIVLEINKRNIGILADNKDYLIIEFKYNGSEIYEHIKQMGLIK